MICASLRPLQQQPVKFDPTNVEHLEAVRMLCTAPTLRQHPTLRFELEQPFTDVRSMLFHKVIEKHLETLTSANGTITNVSKKSYTTKV